MGIGGHNVPFVRDRWGIRRLRVEEVARFQGFESPDTLFPDIPEKERYRLLGNAVCAKLARLVGTRCADRGNAMALMAAGWSVLTIWECELRDLDRVMSSVYAFLASRRNEG